jgi:hypothetical protein
MQLRESWNPIVLDHDKEFLGVIEGLSPNELIREYRLVFTRRVLCLVESREGGGYWSRKDWDCPVPIGATVRFVELPRGGGGSNPLQIIATIALIVASVYTGGIAAAALGGVAGAAVQAGVLIAGSLLLNMFFGSDSTTQQDQGQPNKIYSINAGGNALRIGQPFAECFGYFKRFPDLVQLSYVSIENNEQFLYFYMIVGVGHYSIHGIYIGETPISEYADAAYNILPPGQTLLADGRYYESIPTIVPRVVWTSQEISGQELSQDWVTAIVSARGTSVEQIEYDVLFQALIGFNGEGERVACMVTVVAEARLVDDDGTALTDWAQIHGRTYVAASISPLRYSNKVAVPFGAGRYQFRVRRTSAKSASEKISDNVIVTGLRGYGPEHPYYGDVTCIEGRVRATERLNGEVVNKINVVATRMLYPVGNSGFGTSMVATTSIFDAIAYIVTSQNGGRQPSSFLKWEIIHALKTTVEYLGHSFNYAFTGQESVMDAVKKAAQCSRMVPYLPGGQFCLVRDDYQALPAVTYTDDDIDEGSLKMTYSLASPDSPTCVRVNFLNPVTWQDDYVVYYDSRGSEEITLETTLDGCLSRQQAYEYAAYLYNDTMNNGVVVEFTTGLKGHIPSLFKKLAIGATHVDWGQSGKIAAVESGLIWLSEPVDFGIETTGKLYISEADGETGGPYTVTKTGNPHCVAGAIIGLKTLQDDDIKASSFLFGPASREPLYIRLMGIQPQARNKVKLFGTIIDDSTYDIPGAAPSRPEPYPPGSPLASVSLLLVGDDEYRASWSGSSTVFRVEVNLGSGYTIIEDLFQAFTKSFEAVDATTITVKVTPYYNGELITLQALTSTITVTPAPTGLSVTAGADQITATWTAVTGAIGYNVEILVADESKGLRYVTEESATIALSDLQQAGGPWPAFTVRVAAVMGAELGLWAIQDITVSALSAPSGPVLQSVLTGAVILSWGAVTGATGYRLYLGEEEGFDPVTEGTLVYSGANLSATVAVDLTAPYAHYFKVAATNAYYQNIADLVFSAELEVSG